MSDIKQTKIRVISGVRPTGPLHLGNYFGAIRNYIKMQDEFDCFFMVADLHSLTTHPDTRELKANVHRVLAENIACGLDPEKYQGFAFGMGLDRITMLKYGIPDLRDMFAGDMRWMRHYGFLPLDVPTLAGGLSS